MVRGQASSSSAKVYEEGLACLCDVPASFKRVSRAGMYLPQNLGSASEPLLALRGTLCRSRSSSGGGINVLWNLQHTYLHPLRSSSVSFEQAVEGERTKFRRLDEPWKSICQSSRGDSLTISLQKASRSDAVFTIFICT